MHFNYESLFVISGPASQASSSLRFILFNLRVRGASPSGPKEALSRVYRRSALLVVHAFEGQLLRVWG